MIGRLNLWMLLTLAVGLFLGPAVRAQGTMQTTDVAYALSLIDAGADGTAASQAGGPVTDATTHVRLKVTVSIPRSAGGSNYGEVPVYANPVRLMYRKHKGPSTAFDGSISLKRDAPYANNDTPLTSAFYPMPQIDSATGQPITDPTKLNYYGVMSNSSTNVKGTAYATYLGYGQAHDLGRWECTFLSADAYNLAGDLMRYPMLMSLLRGESTYEWYAASRYGLGTFARISDIQDLGRNMAFTDLRLWVPNETSSAIDLTSQATLGKFSEYTLSAMPGQNAAPTWHIYKGAIGSNYIGQAGAQLLNEVGSTADHGDAPRIESPYYPDGIASVVFEAMASSVGGTDGMELLVQYTTNGTTWQNVETVTLKEAFRTYTVSFGDHTPSGNAATRFRLVRLSQVPGGGAAYLTTYVIRNLLVRSAAPKATFGKPQFTSGGGNVLPFAGAPFSVLLVATGDGSAVPRGYDATLRIRRRAEGDASRAWQTAPVSVTTFSESDGNATLSSGFTVGTLQNNPDGTVNADEGAFFLGNDGAVTGMMPQVYDLALDYSILGSFKAGRNEIDLREAVTGRAVSYADGMDESGAQILRPYLLDLREQPTANASVFLRVMYRSGTGASALPYTLETLDLPLLPSAHQHNAWRVDVSKVLRLAEDETAVYAWGYKPPPGAGDAVFSTGYLSFTVCSVEPDGTASWFGQKQPASSPSTMPPTTDPVPAVSETLGKAASEADAVPMVVPLNRLPNSHLMVEMDFASLDEPILRLCGSYWQDFNTWYAPSDNFTETDFREDVQKRVADFNCATTENADGSVAVTGGWIPDEGPLADTTSFTDRFIVGRGTQTGVYPFYMSDMTYVARSMFAPWGASSTRAEPKYLREGEDAYNYYTEYMQFGRAAEVVLNRSWTQNVGGTYQPDAQIRLRRAGNGIWPRSDVNQGVVLNGVGTVSFTLGLSLPYNISRIAQLVSKTGDLFAFGGYGVSAGVQFNRPAETCASSGYSVSYYLVDVRSNKKFELRVSQILNFGTATEQRPEASTIAELYQWSGDNATRLELIQTGSTTAIPNQYYPMGNNLSPMAFGLWVMADGRLAVGSNTSATATSLNIQFRSRDVVASTTSMYALALGSAECRPIFRYISRTASASTGFAAVAINPADVSVYEAQPPAWAGSGSSWTLASDSTSSARIQITRRTPSAEAAGKVIVSATRSDGGRVPNPRTFSTNKTGEAVSVTLGAANAQLSIEPFDDECNVFIDNVFVSSWCGNDDNRNGNAYVPKYTNAGFFSANGFAGVGVWIRPEEDDQLNVAPKDYSGRQSVLLQRSRQNTSKGLSGEVATGGVKNTGSSLAVYGPFSETGFGAVSFRYRIPSQDEYGNQGELPSVYVMLQYLADPSYYNNYLGGNVPSGWQNVSDPVALRNSAGVWTTASITPKLAGAELIGVKGTLRLVMVTDGLLDSDDPYVYIDDFTVTDNAVGTLASWSARNVKLTDTPINLLYWKDRAATAGATPEETTFAEKSSLTRGFQFNDVMSGNDTDGTYDTCVLDSPLLENGVGRVTFAARLAEAQTQPARLYIFSTTDTSDNNATFLPVTYVDVTNTVYNVYDVDLSKYTNYYTPPKSDLSPGTPPTGSAEFKCSDARRIRLRVYLEGDGTTQDGFEMGPVRYGRVMTDCLAVADPITPSLRVASVAFSNVAGASVPAEFVRNSPRSQPVSNAPVLRAMVALDREQLLQKDSIRVFMTVRPHALADTDGYLKKFLQSTDYRYTDVLGNPVTPSASQPVYAWDPTKLDKWPLSAWFDLTDAFNKLQPQLGAAGPGPLTPEDLADLGISNSVELSKAAGSDALNFFGDLSKVGGLTTLPENSLVQYTAWAVYRSEESDQWFVTQISPSSYTDFPWNFPRNLNTELRAKAAEAGMTPSADFFSPYYWVYSCIPGEVFINEFDLADNSAISNTLSLTHFIELCAPVGVPLNDWRVATTGRSSTSAFGGFVIPQRMSGDDTTLTTPGLGAVPNRRAVDTTANRSFYTAFSSSCAVYYRDGGVEKTDLPAYKNAGMADRNYDHESLGSGYAASVLLYRPTGGAEHIVVFTTANENSAGEATYQTAIDTLYETYRSAYVSQGFATEWVQTFVGSSWEDAQNATADNITAATHARRLAKADMFVADMAKDNRFTKVTGTNLPVQDSASTGYANSIATVDMGGMWVTRKNAINVKTDNGPTDLTNVSVGEWPAGINPTEQTRHPDPTGGTANLQPVVQVTPRQINPDQFLIPYTGLSQSAIVSTLTGGFGTHTLEILDSANTTTDTRRGGRTSPVTWSVDATVPRVKLTYDALLFHTVGSIALRLIDSKSSLPVTDSAVAAAALAQPIGGSIIASGPDTQGWMTLTVPANSSTFGFYLFLGPTTASSDVRYNVEANTGFVLNMVAARDVITRVSPYCGDAFPGTAKVQPWWGSGFGFEVNYDAAITGGAELSSVLVTYPAPGRQELAEGLSAKWTGTSLTYTPTNPDEPTTPLPEVTVSLDGMEYVAATNALSTVFRTEAGTRYVELKGASNGRVADPSVIGILSTAYATANGYNSADPATAGRKEPAIPFCVWGVYSVSIQTDRGNEKVSFLMRQAAPGAKPGIFVYPRRYAPLPDLNIGKDAEKTAPYFYLYSTPPQSAWLNELNLVKSAVAPPPPATDSEPYAEVVMPILRQGILDATPTVPQTDNAGWAVQRYAVDGALATTTSLTATSVASGSPAYSYNTVGITAETAAKAAYVLIRPCGAAEGGVWTGVDATGGTPVVPPAMLTDNTWLIPATDSFVVTGQTDTASAAGSVQLVGQVEYDDLGLQTLSSDVTKRTDWKFAAESKNTDNEGLRPDTKPVWNQVTVTSSLRNNVYGGTPCGYQMVPGFFSASSVTGVTDPVTLTLSGQDWVYGDVRQNVLSYRPRSTYRFESLTVPPDLVGHIMLVGNDKTLSADQVSEEVKRLKALTSSSAKTTDWISMNGRASVEYRTVVDADGISVHEPTGRILFDTAHPEGVDGDGNEVTFGDLDTFVVTLVFAEEPPSAQNTVVMAFGQGDVKAGAWLATQTLYAQKSEGGAWAPDADKGGDAVTNPIWSDKTGNKDGEHANVHGWLHQPVVGDRLGMAAVVNPELGLSGLANVQDRLTATNASLRPFLVWTLIPKGKVPTNLFDVTKPGASGADRNTFLRKWSLPQWIGSPSVGDGATLSLRELRTKLRSEAETTGAYAFYSAAGIIPMAYQGYQGADGALTTTGDRAQEPLFAFRTMTEVELAAAKNASDATGISDEGAGTGEALLPYASAIDLSDATLWQDGAVLRFAVVIADARDGLVYDCQSIANFSSDALAAYCPWYIPDATSNINAVTTGEESGVSPYAWVYAIAQGGVWLNEFRPFSATDGKGNTMPSAFELAMWASPLETRTDGLYVPTYSLDGWTVVMKYAPLPLVGASKDTPLPWVTHRTVDLRRWVPYRRINPDYDTNAPGSNPKFYDLDFYCASTDAATGFAPDPEGNIVNHPYSAETVNTFKWLKLSEELFDPGLDADLRSRDAYAAGVVYALALVRNNGVVADEVLFYNTSVNDSVQTERMLLAVDSENANNAAAGTVRGVTAVKLPLSVAQAAATAQFSESTRMVGGTPVTLLEWIVDVSMSSVNTLPGANVWGGFTQPYVSYEPQFVTGFALSAQLLGGDGNLLLTQAGGIHLGKGRVIGAQLSKGAQYTLSVAEWNPAWFSLGGVTKNGRPFEPALTRQTVYAMAPAGTLASTQSLTVDNAILTEDTDYALTFVYTPDAARLAASGALNSEDDGFLQWLLQADPGAVLGQSASDGITAAEKYWLGLDSAKIDATDVSLAFTLIGTHQEPQNGDVSRPGDIMPAVSISLKKGSEPIEELRGDGVLVLLGKPSLDGEWRYLRRLYPEDINGDRMLILKTDCRFFKATLLSARQAQGLTP